MRSLLNYGVSSAQLPCFLLRLSLCLCEKAGWPVCRNCSSRDLSKRTSAYKQPPSATIPVAGPVLNINWLRVETSYAEFLFIAIKVTSTCKKTWRKEKTEIIWRGDKTVWRLNPKNGVKDAKVNKIVIRTLWQTTNSVAEYHSIPKINLGSFQGRHENIILGIRWCCCFEGEAKSIML